MSQDIFNPLAALQDERLDQLGNPLVELDRLVDWGAFRPLLESARGQERKSPAGASAKDSAMMFKGLALQSLCRLSDAQLEFQIEDRRSFQRFLGLGNHQLAPGRNTFWAFRERLLATRLGRDAVRAVCPLVGPSRIHRPQRADRRCLSGIGSRAAQHPGREPPDQAGRCAPRVDGQPAPARWTSRRGKHSYGYKNHIGIDNHRKLIRSCQAADASVHDSQRFAALPDPDNTGGEVWADSACRSQEAEGMLREAGYRSRVRRKARAGKPLGAGERRCRVEHVFGAQSALRRKAIRSIGMARARTEIGMMNLVYNLRRWCFLERAAGV